MLGTELASRYRVERLLGEGGMGRVFEATDQELGRRVAVKLMRDDLDNPAARDRFRREARAAAALTHPNACQLFEVAEHEGDPFLVMEFLDGQPLSERLAQGPLSLDEVRAVLLPLLDVLSAFHEAGLIHRDLKPSNIFLTAQGVKLLDFGLARRTERSDALTAPALTVPGVLTGTLRYMAPEQITGDPVDARTDIFSLGVILFEMLTGNIPFGAKTNVEWLNAVLTQDAPSLGDPALHALDAIVERALRRNAHERYQTVGELSAALRAVLEPTEAVRLSDAAADDEPSIVVLPFRLLQDDDTIAILQHGLADALTVQLSGVAGIRVVSNRVAQDLGESSDLVSLGNLLKVARVLSGTVLRADQDVRVMVQLIDAADGSVAWSQTSQHRVDNVLTLQDDICRRILDELPLTTHAGEAI